jgi:hypothetical protein
LRRIDIHAVALARLEQLDLAGGELVLVLVDVRCVDREQGLFRGKGILRVPFGVPPLNSGMVPSLLPARSAPTAVSSLPSLAASASDTAAWAPPAMKTSTAADTVDCKTLRFDFISLPLL